MTSQTSQAAALPRRFGLLQASALNMANMVGVGPFITIPLLMSTLGGPQALLGWIFALAIVICDGMVWSELGAALPGSGGSYGYLLRAYGPQRWGRLMGFLFIWQFIISGPLEIASGYIGFSQYLGYIVKNLTTTQTVLIAMGVGLLNLLLLYRRISSIAYITVTLWVGTILTSLAVVVTGAFHFQSRIAFDFPPGAFGFSLGFVAGLAQAARIGIYDYLGYYDVCYIGDEVKDPGKVIPRSILISVIVVACIYIGINLSIIGVIPWQQFVPAEKHPEANYIVSIFMERIYGSTWATLFTLAVLWTAFGSVFALLLGYSRIPFAAAQKGSFFAVFGKVHPQGQFPHVSLIVIGLISILCCYFSLQTVIDALIASRILIQFIGQIGAVILLRRHEPGLVRPYRVWLYPVPLLIAFLGWGFLFASSGKQAITLGLVSALAGIGAFLIWSYSRKDWPFGKGPQP